MRLNKLNKPQAMVLTVKNYSQEGKNMNFSEFSSTLTILVNAKLGDNYEVSNTKITKNNGNRLHGINVKCSGKNVSPTFYVDDLYDQYEHGEISFEECFEKIAREVRKTFDNLPKTFDNLPDLHDFSKVKDKILYKLINTAANEELLKDIPYETVNDLSKIFFVNVSDKVGEMAFTIRNEHMSAWGITAEDISSAADANMPQMGGETFMSLAHMINQLTGIQTVDESEDTESTTFVLSNRDKVFGAAAALYTGEIQRLAERREADIYIIPSSIHEVLLLVDSEETDAEDIKKTILDVNEAQVAPEERLSNNLYKYCRETNKIEVVA